MWYLESVVVVIRNEMMIGKNRGDVVLSFFFAAILTGYLLLQASYSLLQLQHFDDGNVHIVDL